eukprot:TRINITY_DN18338_c0_g3_i1.p1 TRINITY_DN18338_c0_g3~~TRINITY_DN18338_c0_g3_i1.p1  ORF type:complete len:584 (+),score=98.34 TRINITY_DN18338_c0_g3_i1:65-1816(+)
MDGLRGAAFSSPLASKIDAMASIGESPIAANEHSELCSMMSRALKNHKAAMEAELEKQNRLVLYDLEAHLCRLKLVDVSDHSLRPPPLSSDFYEAATSHSKTLNSDLPCIATEAELPGGVASPRGDTAEITNGAWDSNGSREDMGSEDDRPSLRRSQSSALSEMVMSGRRSRTSTSGGSKLMALMDRLVMSSGFEIIFGALIFANTIVMAIESQYHGMGNGSRLGYPIWKDQGMVLFFVVCEWFFGVLFTIELLLKIVVLRSNFLVVAPLDCGEGPEAKPDTSWWKRIDHWNIIDFFIVAFWVITVLSRIELPIDPMLLRLARLARLLRLLRLVKTIQAFDSLYLITATIRGSLSALCWSAVLLFVIQMLIAFVLVQFLEGYILDDSNPLEKRDQVYKYFGSFSRAMFSMFELTLGNFVPISRLLMDEVSEWYILFSITHKCAIGFAIVSVVRGVFMHETFKVAATDDHIMVSQKVRAKKIHRKKMTRLFDAADTDGNGTLDKEEFAEICRDEVLKTWLASMELDIQNSDLVFDILTRGEELLTVDMLVAHMGSLKGPARGIDLASVHHDLRALRELVETKLG